MADKTQQLILDGLSHAVAEPKGVPLFGGKTRPGLFAVSGPAKQAAQLCKDSGYLHVVGSQTKGKATLEICAITEKGIAHLLSQVSPKQVLEQFVRSVDNRGKQVGELIDAAKQCQATMESLKAQVAKVLTQVQSSVSPSVAALHQGTNGTHRPEPRPVKAQEEWKSKALDFLAQWQSTKPNEDCPLPELYRRAVQHASTLSIGQFHDGLRQLHDQNRVYLHPWTGPLYEVPEPAYALMVGHVVAYYASVK